MKRLMTLVVVVVLAALSVAIGAQVAAPRSTAPPGYRQLVSGLLARSRFTVDAPGGRRVELWDLLVGPGLKSAEATLPGAAVLEVRGGSGQIVVGGKPQDLRAGATLSVPERTSFQVVNTRTDLGLSIRATVILGARR
jgi:hypothetical protein